MVETSKNLIKCYLLVAHHNYHKVILNKLHWQNTAELIKFEAKNKLI